MKMNPGESYESWADRVRMYEHGHAMQRIAKGDLVDAVLEDMARRITNRLMHPLLMAIKDIPIESSNVDKKAEYYEDSAKRGPVADHVVED